MRIPLWLVIFSFPIFARAGGSVDFDFHAKPLLQKSPALYKFVEEALDVSKTGDGVRLGKDAGPDEGKRVPPFTFEAKPKSYLGAFVFVLTIDQTEDGLPKVTIQPIWPPHSSAAIQSANASPAPKRPILEAGKNYSESDLKAIEGQARDYISSLIPLGADLETARATLKAGAFEDIEYNAHSGVILPQDVATKRGITQPIGTQSIVITLAKVMEPKIPMVLYLFVFLGFDAQGKLIAIEPLSEIDAP